MIEVFVPEHLSKWSVDGPTGFDSGANYAGDDFSEFYVAPVSQTRDSGPLELSNYRVVRDEILKASQHELTDEHCFGHWACGWYEIILIHHTDYAALKVAEEWDCALADYPVACDDDYSELEFERASEYWERMSTRCRMDVCEKYGISVFAARRDEIPECPTGEIISYLAE
jgi:hypothetical protein